MGRNFICALGEFIDRRKGIIIIAMIILSIVLSGFWLLKRATIGAYRHALNHQEFDKDNYKKELDFSCKEAGKYLKKIDTYHENKLVDEVLANDEIFRHVIYDSDLLKNEFCIAAVINSAKLQKYNMKIFFIDSKGSSLIISTYKWE